MDRDCQDEEKAMILLFILSIYPSLLIILRFKLNDYRFDGGPFTARRDNSCSNPGGNKIKCRSGWLDDPPIL